MPRRPRSGGASLPGRSKRGDGAGCTGYGGSGCTGATTSSRYAGSPNKVRRNARGVGRLRAALRMDSVAGHSPGAGHVRLGQSPPPPHASLAGVQCSNLVQRRHELRCHWRQHDRALPHCGTGGRPAPHTPLTVTQLGHLDVSPHAPQGTAVYSVIAARSVARTCSAGGQSLTPATWISAQSRSYIPLAQC